MTQTLSHLSRRRAAFFSFVCACLVTVAAHPCLAQQTDEAEAEASVAEVSAVASLPETLTPEARAAAERLRLELPQDSEGRAMLE
jgi:hypothetical protein